jgi:hypothetical protein
MDSKLRCVFVVDENNGESGSPDVHEYSTAKTENTVKAQALSSSPKVNTSSPCSGSVNPKKKNSHF